MRGFGIGVSLSLSLASNEVVKRLLVVMVMNRLVSAERQNAILEGGRHQEELDEAVATAMATTTSKNSFQVESTDDDGDYMSIHEDPAFDAAFELSDQVEESRSGQPTLQAATGNAAAAQEDVAAQRRSEMSRLSQNLPSSQALALSYVKPECFEA